MIPRIRETSDDFVARFHIANADVSVAFSPDGVLDL